MRMVKLLVLLLLGGVFLCERRVVADETRIFKVTFYCSCPKCCGRYSPNRGGSGLTARGNQPLPFRTVAVGDPALLGKWIYFEDLGGWVLASDTGVICPLTGRSFTGGLIKSKKRSIGCVARNQADVFVGGPNMHKRALEMGVQEWEGRVLESSPFAGAGGR